MVPFNFFEDEDVKIVRSENTNYNFNKKTGYTEMWGKSKDEDIVFSDIGPHILDLEISTICDGYKSNGRCPACYKFNTNLVEKNMSLETFKTIMDKMMFECNMIEFNDGYICYINSGVLFPKKYETSDIKNVTKVKRTILMQIAVGSGAYGIENPEVFDMMEYARSIGVIPNITVANLSDENADKFAKVCGAMAISRYQDKNICYDTIKKLTDRGMNQINMHFVVHKYSKNQAIETMKDMMTDPRLSKMNAIVFLSLKKKGNGENLQLLDQDGFNEIVQFAFDNNIKFGMDSCSGGKFIRFIKDREDYEKIYQMIEPCESTKISSYINVDGEFYSCSFCEKTDSFKNGVNVLESESFVKDVWYDARTVEWRNNLLKKNAENNFDCPVFEV